MKRTARLRRVFKWTGAALCAAVLAIWCGTIAHDVYCRVPRLGLLFAGEGYIGYFGTNTHQWSDWNESYGGEAWAVESAPEDGILAWDLWPFDPEEVWQASPVLADLGRRALIVFLDGGGVAIPGSLAFTMVMLPTAVLFFRDRRPRLASHRFSRLRQRLKWIGTGLVASVIGVWLISLFYAMGIQLPRNIYVGTQDAVITAFWIENEIQPDAVWTTRLIGPQFGGFGLIWPHQTDFAYNSGEWGSVTVIPFWTPMLIIAVPTALLWHRDRRCNRPGCCLRCGYDLTGNISGVCSECGDKARPRTLLPDS